jgi:hypothetical protein
VQTPDNHKLLERLPGWNRAMHREGRFPGKSFARHLPALTRLCGALGKHRFLDYGCGPAGGLAWLFPKRAWGFDPYVEGYEADPWGHDFNVVFTADVLEHMTVGQVRHFLKLVKNKRPEFVFLVAATRPAAKTYPNGINVHLTVEPPSWWMGLAQGVLGDEFVLDLAEATLLNEEVALGFRRRDVPRPPGPLDGLEEADAAELERMLAATEAAPEAPP